MKEANKHLAPRFTEQAKRSETMKKFLLVFLVILFVAPLLSGCCPFWFDGGGRGYYGYDRGYDGHRDGSRDYRERR